MIHGASASPTGSPGRPLGHWAVQQSGRGADGAHKEAEGTSAVLKRGKYVAQTSSSTSGRRISSGSTYASSCTYYLSHFLLMASFPC